MLKIISSIKWEIFKIISTQGKYYCPVCGNRAISFGQLPHYYTEQLNAYGHKYPGEDCETLNEKNYSCHFCGASDRDRLYALYIKRYFREIDPDRKFKLLDFAPSQALSLFIKELMAKASPNFSYRTADLFMEGVDDKVDITNMSIYADNQFDFFICSHVLEHVVDDKKAMRELYRILKLGGRGILMVPIILTIDEIDEDPSITDIAERWRRFGQHDHVRLYSKKGFIERAEETGFLIHQLGKEFFGEEVFARNGITNQSVLYVVEKN